MRANPHAAEIDPERARQLADALVLRHAELARSTARHPDAAQLAGAVHDAVCAIEKLAPELAATALRETAAAQAQFLETHADLLLARAAAGRVLAGALVLRLADFTFQTDGTARLVPTADATGAGPADVCVELAGIAVELLAAGRVEPAERLISHYAGEANDFDLYRVVDLYERCGALERAAAAVKQDGEEARAIARRLILVAQAGGRRSVLPPLVVAIGGTVASGKSTLARALADRMAAPRVVADRIRDQQLFGVAGRVHESGWAEAFDAGFHDRVYAELLRRADCALDSGRAVVLDGCFSRARDRDAARSLARRHQVPFRFVECRVDPAVQRTRLTERDDASARGGWQAIADALAAEWEPAIELSEPERVILDTSGALAASAAQLEVHIPTWPSAVRH